MHIGSLVTAAASYLAARQRGGRWLVRIEDIDPPREIAGAASAILRTLDRFELRWDGPVQYQSARTDAYRAAAEDLLRRGLAYRCRCSRGKLRRAAGASENGQRYPGFCREKRIVARDAAVRLRTAGDPIRFRDGLQGDCAYDIDATIGDYVIFRRDGLPAYHLAVVLDDAAQGITDVVRGADLLDSTAAHIHLQRTLALATPAYSHLPVIVNGRGQKLSKQTGATAVDAGKAGPVAVGVLRYLGLEPPTELHGAPPGELWRWAIARWEIGGLAGRRELAERSEA